MKSRNCGQNEYYFVRITNLQTIKYVLNKPAWKGSFAEIFKNLATDQKIILFDHQNNYV